MNLDNAVALVTGGASGLGLASAKALLDAGATVVVADMSEAGDAVVSELGDRAHFVVCDVTDPASTEAAVAAATELGELRALVHCAGRGGPVRVLDREGNPGSYEEYEAIVRVNLLGTYNVLRLSAAAMAANEPVDGERGVCVLTSSVAAWEGQIGQTAYASSKAGVVGMTLVAARDLASKLIRVATIAPGLFDTPLLARVPAEARAKLETSVPHPSRLGQPEEYAKLAMHIIDNAMINGETIRLDGAIRMAPR